MAPSSQELEPPANPARFTPNRKYAGRMKQMLYELKTSKDPIWILVSER
jgi:hypothetical protein